MTHVGRQAVVSGCCRVGGSGVHIVRGATVRRYVVGHGTDHRSRDGHVGGRRHLAAARAVRQLALRTAGGEEVPELGLVAPVDRR